MCTVSINIDEAKLRSINPSLNGAEAISHWLQGKVDAWMRQYAPTTADLDVSSLHPDLQRILSFQRMDVGDIGINGEKVRDEYYQKK